MSGIMQMVLASKGALVAGNTGFVFPNVFSAAGWANPGNVAASDDVYATDSMPAFTSSEYFGSFPPFSVPAGATILGLEVKIEVKSEEPTNLVSDIVIQFTKTQDNATLVGTNKATGARFATTTEQTFTIGGASDLWGTTWTAAEINSGLVGPVVRFGTDVATDCVLSIDAISVKIYYEA